MRENYIALALTMFVAGYTVYQMMYFSRPVTVGDMRVCDADCRNRHNYNTSISCARPRGILSYKHGNQIINVSQRDMCGRNVRWGTKGGWDQLPPKQPELNTGQNLEDAVIIERFFRRGPLAYLTNNTFASSGVFVEMGALDGVVFSNTLLLEHCLGWTGLLVEAHPDNAKQCRRNRPCTPVVQSAACSPPQQFQYISKQGNAVSSIRFENNTKKEYIPVPCRPLADIFAENNLKRIHFFSLDVEGAELLVLKTIDWSKVHIDVLMVETDLLHRNKDLSIIDRVLKKTADVRRYLRSVGMIRVPSRVSNQENGTKPLFLSITGSDIFLGNKELLEFDDRLW